MKALYTVLLTMAMTATNALATSGGETVELNFMTVLFMGFGALIIVFQLIPGVILFAGMIKGALSPADKKSEPAN